MQIFFSLPVACPVPLISFSILSKFYLKIRMFLRYWGTTATQPWVEIIVLTVNITTETVKRYLYDITNKSYSSFKNFVICHLHVSVHEDI